MQVILNHVQLIHLGRTKMETRVLNINLIATVLVNFYHIEYLNSFFITFLSSSYSLMDYRLLGFQVDNEYFRHS